MCSSQSHLQNTNVCWFCVLSASFEGIQLDTAKNSSYVFIAKKVSTSIICSKTKLLPWNKTRVGSHTRLQMWMAAALDKAGEIEIEMVAPWLLRGCSVVMPSLFPGNVLVLDLSTNFYQPANTWYMEASPSSIWTTVFDLNRHFRPETAWASSLFFS